MTDRDRLWATILAEAGRDPRVTAVIDYGSSARGEADLWSDLDVILLVQGEHFDAFERDWRAWAGRCGRLLHAYAAGPHRRAMFEADPVPLRVDLGLFPDDNLEQRIGGWTLHATHVGAAVRLDRSAQLRVTRLVEAVIARAAPALDLRVEAEHVIGDFWYYALRIHALTQRGEWLSARTEYHWYILDGLAAMLRLIHGEPGRWRLSHAMRGIHAVLSKDEQAGMTLAVPGEGRQAFVDAFERALSLGRSLSTRLAEIAEADFDPGTSDRIIKAVTDGPRAEVQGRVP